MPQRLSLPRPALLRNLVLVALFVAAVFALRAPEAGASRIASAQAVDLGHAYPATQSPANGEVVSGRIRWQVAVRGAKPRQVVLSVDGKVAGRRGSRRAVTTLDTRKLSNGRHRLTATAILPNGRKGGKSHVTVTVGNPTPAPAPAPAPDPAIAPAANGSNSIYWGAWIGDQLTGTQAPWDMNAVTRFEQMAGKNLSLEQFGSPWADCPSPSTCSYYSFPYTPLNDIRSHGAIPFLSWSSQGSPGALNQPDFQLSDVISGRYDSYIRSYAQAARSWGHPFFLRFNWEMNGSWFPWSEGVNGNQPGEYVAAWRHVHDIFTSVGATNASWVWCPNVDPNGTVQGLSELYPGDSYVDWTCLDGYNWGTNPARPLGWKSFDQLYSSSYHQIADTIAPSKPVAIGEFGTSEYGGSKSAWIRDALARIPGNYPKIRAISYFERFDDGMDWPIETSTGATSAFAAGIQSPSYAANNFGGLSAGAIPPPTS